MNYVARVFLVIISLFCAVAAVASAESGFLDFASPQFLGGNGSAATLDSPAGTLLNPAASADHQRITLDFSYLALGGTWVPIKIGNIQVTVTSQGATTPHGTFTAILYWTTSSDPLNAADNTSGLKVDEDKWVQLDGSF